MPGKQPAAQKVPANCGRKHLPAEEAEEQGSHREA
jgi:hypothetical protein